MNSKTAWCIFRACLCVQKADIAIARADYLRASRELWKAGKWFRFAQMERESRVSFDVSIEADIWEAEPMMWESVREELLNRCSVAERVDNMAITA